MNDKKNLTIWRTAIGAVVSLGLLLAAGSALAGDTVSKPEYEVKFTGQACATGAEAQLALTVVAKGDHHVNKDYPSKVTVTAPAGVEVTKAKLDKGDAKFEGEDKMVFAVPVKGAKPGTYTVSSTIKFSVCNESVCLLKEETVTADVTVE